MALKHPRILALAALIVAWLFDFLFWQKPPGISFTIFVVLSVGAGLALIWREGRRPALSSLWLLLPVISFSAFVWIRREPFTLFVNFLITLTGMALLANTLLGGQWMFYTLSDYVVGAFRLTGSALGRAGAYWLALLKEPRETQSGGETKAKLLPVVRGILLAFPVVAILAVLLAAADPVFSKGIEGFLNLFRIENLGEYLFRVIYILIGAYILAGVYLHGLFSSQDERLLGKDQGWLPRFLGWVEAVIVLGSVVLLFAAFVAVQFRYFFGGQANIALEGFTYADYARRGFGELVAVAVISLLLFLTLSAVTRRETSLQRRIFSGLGVGLVVLVVVMLVSAFQRLVLYETAYGFSRLRTYTHIFMVWLGILLAATVVLELFNRQRAFALATLLAVLGFGISLNLINVDAFIVRQNVERARQGSELDMAYLASLSEDAVPALMDAYTNPGLPAHLRDRAAAAVTCREQLLSLSSEDDRKPAWQSFNLSHARAEAVISGYARALEDFQPKLNGSSLWVVEVAGEDLPCYTEWAID